MSERLLRFTRNDNVQCAIKSRFENSPLEFQGFPGDSCPKITFFGRELRMSG